MLFDGSDWEDDGGVRGEVTDGRPGEVGEVHWGLVFGLKLAEAGSMCTRTSAKEGKLYRIASLTA